MGTQTSRKVALWDGPNKRRSRACKLQIVLGAQKSGFLPAQPHTLTFAGTQAHFERSLVGREITAPDKIVTIQTYEQVGGHKGEPVLRALIKKRDECLPGMYIWPHNFHTFSENYSRDNIYTPPVSCSGGTLPRWHRCPTLRKEMDRFLDKSPAEFSIMDIDFCGVFSEANGNDVIRTLTNSGARRGVLFVNHQKGRDGRGGRLFKFLKKYYHFCEYFDVDGFSDTQGNRMDFGHEDRLSYWFVRYVLVPVFYACEAFNAGYRLEVDRLVEYRDRNKNSHAGVTMLQWCFRFEKLESPALQGGNSMAKFIKTFNRERKRLEEHLDLIAREAYPYTDHID